MLTVAEMVGPSYRVLAATAIQLVWAVAYMALAGIAFLLRDRFTLHIAISAPLVLLPILFYWYRIYSNEITHDVTIQCHYIVSLYIIFICANKYIIFIPGKIK